MKKQFTKMMPVVLALLMLCTALPMTVGATSDSDFTYTVSNGVATITGYTGNGGVVLIPETLGGFPVTAIGDYAFSAIETDTDIAPPLSAYSIETIIIPASVTSIGEGAFFRLKNNVSYPLKDSAFQLIFNLYYSKLKTAKDLNVYIPSSVNTINPDAFVCGIFYDTSQKKDMKINIYYEGTEYDWNQLYNTNNLFENTEIFYDSVNLLLYNTTNTVTYNTYGHNWEIQSVAPATCKTEEITKFECTICNSYKTEITGPKTEHHWINNSITPSTCTEPGYIIYICECDDSYKEDIPLLAHNDKNGDGYCDGCNELLCSHMCHKSGFLGLFWKIINLLNKLFGKFPVCSCGMAHY